MAALLEATQLRYAYRGARAVNAVSLEVGAGEVVALLGANGAGKSTSVKLIAGALRPQSGRILWDGADITGRPAHRVVRKGITLVPEGRLLFQQMTVLDNLLVGAVTAGDAASVRRSLEQVFVQFPRLAERRLQLAGSLSGGEQQMLAIARGLMASPRLLILDEPSLGLAPQFVAAMFELVRRLNRAGIAVLLVEQNVHASLKLANRAYVLEKGSVVLSGPAAEMLDNPFVKKAFLGL